MTMEHGEDCCVKVAVHVRPLIGDEKLQGCKDCIAIVPGKPQVQIGSHSFTFDHVYGSTGTPSAAMFDECVAPLVEGLFQGYNATVLAYGQTGSGKTYTMGTACKEGSYIGIIPRAMAALFEKIEGLKSQVEFQLRVSFIEILKEEVRDLLDPATAVVGKVENGNGHAKMSMPGKPPVQIRESSNGVITLAGLTEVHVTTQKEMTACLEQGSLSRATGSTNMNNQSSRSHAIFTITLEQMRKTDPIMTSDGMAIEDFNEDYLCAKLHLVDLAGSERAKRTGSDGLRFKEACISPADINAEETLNTLKYANRARNIQNKPIVNRNPIADEMKRMRQQIEYLQAELVSARGGVGSDDVQSLRERISWLEQTNEDLCRELYDVRNRSQVDSCEPEMQKTLNGFTKSEGLKRSLQSTDPFDVPMTDSARGNTKDIDEVAKELEHTMLQDSMDKELNELNRRLEQKESQMKMYGCDTVALKQHFGKKLMELEEEKRAVQQERDRLLAEVESLSADGHSHKLRDAQLQKLKSLEAQIQDLKKKQENQVQLLKEKQKSDEAAKKLQEEIQFIKAQKVQLQHKIKQEAEQFRQWKATREKELLQVLQRKTEEAAMATKRLKEILEARKSSVRDNSVTMATQLSEAEERERSFSGRGRWNQLRSMGEAKSLLQYIFNLAADARCHVREKEIEIKEMKEQMTELVGILRHSESRRREVEKQLKQREQTAAMATTPPRSENGSVKHCADDPNTPLSPVAVPAQKQLKYSAGIVNSPRKGIAVFDKDHLKMIPIAQLSVGKKVSISGQSGKLWRWKRSHHQWLLQFKWKWQKPWKLSEMIRHSDETISRARPRPQLLPHKPHRVM
ncbi:hypothetical protein PR202_gn00488 [Eleusine coracana subsp. coracana]|uniref:Kinesin-like protein n=1 Tax=Eleusine coracana subsp. coracana TaxID=191504 RepID=A0AAV5G273_ELECO|nr:hypothetical protein PR202_gn00488 [Eleusine coracana subsp. coracana]